MSDTDREERAHALIGSFVANRYQLEALLGLGATGAVYRALHPDGHAVAVKILDSELMASDAAHRFSRESEVVLGIHHPNVVRTLAAGADEALGILYLAMPLLSGEDLDSVLRRVGPLDPTTAARIAIQAARGIGAAHRVGVVHRDVKPANLFLDTERDGRIVVRVCDFGIAKRVVAGGETSVTAPGSQLGTPDYVSPEQLKDSKSVDARTDVWGLGATLYEMLAGDPPFAHHASVFDVIAAILSEDPPHLQDRAAWIEPGLTAVVHRTLQRSPAARPSTMQELIDELMPYSGGDERLTAAHIKGPSSVVRSVRRPRVELPASARPEPRGRSNRPAPAPTVEQTVPAANLSASAETRASAERRASGAPRTHDGRPRWWFFALLGLVLATAALLWFRGYLR